MALVILCAFWCELIVGGGVSLSWGLVVVVNVAVVGGVFGCDSDGVGRGACLVFAV